MTRRDSRFWDRLTKDERSLLVLLERADKQLGSYGGGGYLPDDCSECPWCSTPGYSHGLCRACSGDLDRLLHKARGVTHGQPDEARSPCL